MHMPGIRDCLPVINIITTVQGASTEEDGGLGAVLGQTKNL